MFGKQYKKGIFVFLIFAVFVFPNSASAVVFDSTYDHISQNYPGEIQTLNRYGASNGDIQGFVDAVESELAGIDVLTDDNFDTIFSGTLLTLYFGGQHVSFFDAVINGWKLSPDVLISAFEAGGVDQVKGLLPESLKEIGRLVKDRIVQSGQNSSGGAGGVVIEEPVVQDNKKNIEADNGGTISHVGVTVDISAGALPGDATISINKLSVEEVNNVVTPGMLLKLGSDIYEIDTTGDKIFNDHITISLPFDPTKIAAGEVPEARYYDGSNWVMIEGIVKDSLMIIKVNHLTKFAVFSVKDFLDIAGHWAKNDIKFLAARGLVKGVSDADFEPDRNITRAEFVTLLVKLLNIKTDGISVSRFSDVSITEWYGRPVNAALNAGLVKGVSVDRFAPGQAVTRQEMVAMIINALVYTGSLDSINQQDIEQDLVKYNDRGQLAPWARASMAAAVNKGIIKGRSANVIAPMSTATRAESAAMIVRLYNLIN